jgi:hypothetical protein
LTAAVDTSAMLMPVGSAWLALQVFSPPMGQLLALSVPLGPSLPYLDGIAVMRVLQATFRQAMDHQAVILVNLDLSLLVAIPHARSALLERFLTPLVGLLALRAQRGCFRIH